MPITLPYGDTYYATDESKFFTYDENNLPKEILTGSFEAGLQTAIDLKQDALTLAIATDVLKDSLKFSDDGQISNKIQDEIIIPLVSKLNLTILREDVSVITELVGSSLSDATLWAGGFYNSTGGVSSTSSYKHTVKRYPAGEGSFDFSLHFSSGASILFFDEAGIFISSYQYGGSINSTGTVNAPVGTYSFGFSQHVTRDTLGLSFKPTTDIYLFDNLTNDNLTNDETPIEESTSLVSSGGLFTTFFKRFNRFDKTNVVDGKYVSQSAGSLSTNATSAVSSIIPVDPNTIYFLQGRTITQREIVFYDSVGTKLKPYGTDGIERSNFTIASVNSAVKSPPTAVSTQFTIKFVGNGIYDNIMFTEGNSEQIYASYDDVLIKDELISFPEVVNTKNFEVVKNSTNFEFRTKFNDTYDTHILIETSNYNNGLANIFSSKLLLPTQGNSDAGIELNGSGGDDSCPSYFNNVVAGGNHGCPLDVITSNSHGKTLADVGSRFSDSSSNVFILLEVIDDNTLHLGSDDSSNSNDWSLSYPTSPITYLDNGSDTSDLTFSANDREQLRPAVIDVVHNLRIDNEIKTENATYFGDEVQLIETYNIVDYVDMLSKIVSNRPTGGYLTQPNFIDGDAIISIKNVFQVQPKGTITLLNTWENLKEIHFDRHFGITQNGYSTPAWATSVKRYFPNALPLTNNSVTYDFRLAPEFKDAVITGTINFTSALWEGGKPLNRVVDSLDGGGLNVNFNLGYLPIGVPRVNQVDKAWYMTSSKKLYPISFDSKISTADVLPIGTVRQGIAFRGWGQKTGINHNNFLVENGGKHYLYLDYLQTGTDRIELPSYLTGKSVTVIDKSANVELQTDFVIDMIQIKITTATPLYGYCELLIE